MEGSGAAGAGDEAHFVPGNGGSDRAQLHAVRQAEGAGVDRQGRCERHRDVSAGAEAAGAERVVPDQGRAGGDRERLPEAGEADRQGLPGLPSRRGAIAVGLGHPQLRARGFEAAGRQWVRDGRIGAAVWIFLLVTDTATLSAPNHMNKLFEIIETIHPIYTKYFPQ